MSEPMSLTVGDLAVEAVKVLRALEWSTMRKGGDRGCPMCWRSIADGHRPRLNSLGTGPCPLGEALRHAAEMGLG